MLSVVDMVSSSQLLLLLLVAAHPGKGEDAAADCCWSRTPVLLLLLLVINSCTWAHLSAKKSSILSSNGWMTVPSAAKIQSVWKNKHFFPICVRYSYKLLLTDNYGDFHHTCVLSLSDISSVCAPNTSSIDLTVDTAWLSIASFKSLTWAKVLFSHALMPYKQMMQWYICI